ncbi:hypothetical protein ACJX0J_016026, partial [Zea mays]
KHTKAHWSDRIWVARHARSCEENETSRLTNRVIICQSDEDTRTSPRQMMRRVVWYMLCRNGDVHGRQFFGLTLG